MKILRIPLLILFGSVIHLSFSFPHPISNSSFEVEESDLEEELCTSSFNDDVNLYSLKKNGREIGTSIWISRKSKKAKAKYFAHRLHDQSPYERFKEWKDENDKEVILKSSGAYATSFQKGKPVGITVDNGEIVNKKLDDRMNALVIVYPTGGIVVSKFSQTTAG